MYCVEWNGKRFAMKVLRKELNKSEVVKCLNELEKIKHPNIIPVYGGNYNPPFVVMKFAEQFSLKEYISLSRLEIPRNIKYTILIGIAKGLLYLHQHNILHLNLNPCNVLLDGDLIPYLSDFSTSVFATNYHGSIRDLSVEKARYLSPEQIDGYEVTQKQMYLCLGW
ncbi:non-specific serine/threonine protein kinase [Entamoeba marina]